MASKATLKRKPVNGGIDAVMKNVKNGVVKIGILRGQGVHPNATGGQTIAEIAFWNEYGTAKIPARPFMRSTLKEEQNKYKQVFKKTYQQMIARKITINRAISTLGLQVSADIQRKITQISSPANTELTKEKKGSSNPLVDTGTLRRSISWVKA